MNVCDFSLINGLTVEDARASIERYGDSDKGWTWVSQYDGFFGTTAQEASSDVRMVELLNIVRGSGWNMNRQGQCTQILTAIENQTISREELGRFWSTVDSLHGFVLRDLPNVSMQVLSQIETSIGKIRHTLRSWHPSSDTLCFLTKVVLMFNWGQCPAFDSRIRSVLRLPPDLSSSSLVTALVEIGTWIKNFESRHGTRLDHLATCEIRRVGRESLRTLPLGRAFDMLLFSLG